MTFKPRPYQEQGYNDVLNAFNTYRSCLYMLPTGAGKTFLFTMITKYFTKDLNKKVLVLCHRKELVEQTIESFAKVGVTSEAIYPKTKKPHHKSDAYVGMIETINNRLKDNPNFFKEVGLVICDECHILVFNKVFDYFPNSKILGCTATPVLTQKETYFKCVRCDREYNELGECHGEELMEWSKPLTMSKFYDTIVLGPSIQYLIDEGFLVKETSFIKKYIDEDKLKIGSDGDYTRKSQAEAFDDDAVFNVVLNYKELCFGKKTMIFTASTKTNVLLLEEFKKQGIENVRSYDSVNDQPMSRKELVKWFKDSSDGILINTGVFTCLLDDTEILTKDGWKTYEQINENDLFAQYDKETKEISFDKAIRSVKKEFKKGYEMINLEGSKQNFCVTKTHNMLVKKNPNSEVIHKLPAKDTVNKRWLLPVSGNATPCNVEVVQESLIKTTKERFISSNSYNYRVKNGMNKEESILYAEKMYEEKSSLKFKNPKELTLEECEFIGFWIGDGTVSKNRWQITQSLANPKMVDYLRNLLINIGLHFTETYYKGNDNHYILGNKTKKNDYITFNLSLGLGGKDQKVNGLYHLKPYLEKNGTDLFWGLNKDQFKHLLLGVHYADGTHGNKVKPQTYDFVCSRRKFVDLIQAISVCRGIRFTTKEVKSSKYKKYFSKNTFTFDKEFHQMSNDVPKVVEIQRDGYYWCVSMPKETIVTRRKGTVTIMGNTGFDDTTVQAIILARSTLSLSLFLQIVGRGGRVTDKIFKDTFIFIDGGGNIARHLEWSDSSRDWERIFYKGIGEDKPKKQALDQITDCENCGMLYSKNTKICPECGHERFTPPPLESVEILSDEILVPIRAIPPPNGEILYKYTKSQNKDINFAFKTLVNRIEDMFIMYRVSREKYLSALNSGELDRKIKKMINKCYFVLVKKQDIIPENWQGRTIDNLVERVKKKLEKRYNIF